ncbi:hypothetical protein ZWY2020_023547 [Hordeum vulgare]|nr:hypothetical protein ZWY2020_023547 [Hordeum vulgare]
MHVPCPLFPLLHLHLQPPLQLPLLPQRAPLRPHSAYPSRLHSSPPARSPESPRAIGAGAASLPGPPGDLDATAAAGALERKQKKKQDLQVLPPFPGCLGRVINMFDLGNGVVATKMLADKAHRDVSPAGKDRSGDFKMEDKHG